MRRREFIALFGGAAVWPLGARAQQPAIPVIGYLNGASAAAWQIYVAAFREGLMEVGYVEDKNVLIEYRWAENQYDRLPELAAELVRRGVAVIYSDGGTVTALAAQKAAKTTPIVFMTGADPVKAGLVASLNRPGGNLTGVTIITNLVITKRLDLLHELLPRASAFALLVNPGNPNADQRLADVQAAAHARGWSIKELRAGSERDLGAAFATLVQQRIDGLLVQADPFFFSQRDLLAALAAHQALPASRSRRSHQLRRQSH
jgi:putative ABC transport system substrate-binding protein